MTRSSLERIYPDTNDRDHEIGGADTFQLHAARYHYAGKNLVPGPVADIACGAGYGTAIIAAQYPAGVESITAVDNSEEAIGYAQEKYRHPLIRFIQADALTFKAPAPFSTIISLETIEHLAAPEDFVRHLAGQLKKGGRFIASAPITPSMDANPYHLSDFSKNSFKKLFLSNGFRELDSFVQVQRYNPFALFNKKKGGRTGDLRKGLLTYYLRHPGKFFLRLKSVFTDGFANKYLVVIFEKQ
ncbi:MAG: methyltransferase domain-containing protein [Sphingobacteriales bacterium]|nr:methyltransferase domain-containing protein [Sphingobacteriales bacterium]